MNQKYLGIGSTLFAISLLAGNGYFAKGLLTDTANLTLIRSFVAAFAIFVFVCAAGQPLALRRKQDYLVSILAGILLGIHWLTFFESMHVSTVTLGMTTLYTYPMMTLCLEAIFFRKKIPWRDWLIAPILVLGVWMMGAPSNEGESNNLTGTLLGLLSALCFAARNLLQQQFLGAYPPHRSIFFQVVTVSGLMLLCLPSGVVPKLSLDVAGQEWHLWLLLGIFFTALPHSLMAQGIRTIGAKSVAVIGCTQPIIASLIAYIVLDEVASVMVLAGAALVLSISMFEIYNQGRKVS